MKKLKKIHNKKKKNDAIDLQLKSYLHYEEE